MADTFDLIVFDWDGTLMDSTAHIVRSMQDACMELELPVPSSQAARNVIGLGLDEALRTACPGQAPSRYADIAAAYRRLYFGRDETIALFDGVKDALDTLHARGIPMAVATGKSRRGLDRAMAATGVTERFATTRTVDECPSKPHPAMLLEIAEQLDIPPARILMVGDTTHDLALATNAGARAVAMTWGAHPADVLADAEPLALFDDFGGLMQWLAPRLG